MLGSHDTAPRALAVADVDSRSAFATGIQAEGARGAIVSFDWATSGRALVATTYGYDVSRPMGCATVHAIVTSEATPGAGPRVVSRSEGCEAPLSGVGAVRWGTGGRFLLVAASATPGLSRIVAVDSATGQLEVVRDAIAGSVQDVARSGAWALVLRDPVADPVARRTAGDYRQLVRLDLSTGAVTVLVDRMRLPIPLRTPCDARFENDRLRWAQLTSDDGRVVLALNVEQGDLLGTRLVYRALTPEGGDAGGLPGDPAATGLRTVDVRP